MRKIIEWFRGPVEPVEPVEQVVTVEDPFRDHPMHCKCYFHR